MHSAYSQNSKFEGQTQICSETALELARIDSVERTYSSTLMLKLRLLKTVNNLANKTYSLSKLADLIVRFYSISSPVRTDDRKCNLEIGHPAVFNTQCILKRENLKLFLV